MKVLLQLETRVWLHFLSMPILTASIADPRMGGSLGAERLRHAALVRDMTCNSIWQVRSEFCHLELTIGIKVVEKERAGELFGEVADPIRRSPKPLKLVGPLSSAFGFGNLQPPFHVGHSLGRQIDSVSLVFEF